MVDDDRAVRESLRRALTLEGYEVDLAEDGADGLARVAGASPDAIVLDVAMPVVDGIEMCRRLRHDGSSLPVLMLTARESVTDRVAGLDAGADDYLVKPFALEELLARLRALLRRATAPRPETCSSSAISRSTRARATSGAASAQMELTRTEFSLLELFLRNPRQVLTRSLIFERVWGYDFGPDVELARGLRRLPAPEDRGRRRAAPHPHGSRHRLRAARAMTLRTRLTLSAALAVAAAVVLASIVVYFVVRSELRGEVDESLRERAAVIERAAVPTMSSRAFRRRCSVSPGGYVQLVAADGSTLRQRGSTLALPVDERTLEVAAGDA